MEEEEIKTNEQPKKKHPWSRDSDDSPKGTAKVLEAIKEEKGKKKEKKVKLPAKAKVNLRRMKEGYCTVVVIEDNHNIDFVKKPIDGGTFKLEDTFHVIDSKDVFFYKNKPIIFQPKRLLNPYNPLKKKHETYGHKYFMVRMLADKITTRKKMSIGIGIGLLIVVGIVIYAIFGG